MLIRWIAKKKGCRGSKGLEKGVVSHWISLSSRGETSTGLMYALLLLFLATYFSCCKIYLFSKEGVWPSIVKLTKTFYIRTCSLFASIPIRISRASNSIKKFCGFRLIRETHLSYGLLHLTGIWQRVGILWLTFRSVKYINVDFFNQIRYFSIK